MCCSIHLLVLLDLLINLLILLLLFFGFICILFRCSASKTTHVIGPAVQAKVGQEAWTGFLLPVVFTAWITYFVWFRVSTNTKAGLGTSAHYVTFHHPMVLSTHIANSSTAAATPPRKSTENTRSLRHNRRREGWDWQCILGNGIPFQLQIDGMFRFWALHRDYRAF